MNPWLRWPLLVLTSPVWLAVGLWILIVLVAGTGCQLAWGAVVNETPQLLIVDFWRDVIRNGR